MLTIREAHLTDLKFLVNTHIEVWSHREFSQKLGKRFVHLFYEYSIESPHCIVNIAEINERPVSYCVGLYRSEEFSKEFKKKIGLEKYWLVISSFLRGKLALNELFYLVSDDYKTRNCRFKEAQIGALALIHEMQGSAEGKNAIRSCIKASLKSLIHSEEKGCWACCDENNIPMRETFKKLGFQVTDSVDAGPRKICILECEFATLSV